jgi:hypothetical protein
MITICWETKTLKGIIWIPLEIMNSFKNFIYLFILQSNISPFFPPSIPSRKSFPHSIFPFFQKGKSPSGYHLPTNNTPAPFASASLLPQIHTHTHTHTPYPHTPNPRTPTSPYIKLLLDPQAGRQAGRQQAWGQPMLQLLGDFFPWRPSCSSATHVQGA